MESKSASEEYWEAHDQEPDEHPSYFTLKVFSSTLMPGSDRLKAHINGCVACRRVVEEDALGAQGATR